MLLVMPSKLVAHHYEVTLKLAILSPYKGCAGDNTHSTFLHVITTMSKKSVKSKGSSIFYIPTYMPKIVYIWLTN